MIFGSTYLSYKEMPQKISIPKCYFLLYMAFACKCLIFPIKGYLRLTLYLKTKSLQIHEFEMNSFYSFTRALKLRNLFLMSIYIVLDGRL